MIAPQLKERFRAAMLAHYGDALGDAAADALVRKADDLAQTLTKLRAQKRDLEARISAQAASDDRTLGKLRRQAEAALAAHVAASSALEAERIRAEQRTAGLRTQIAEIDRHLAPPIDRRACGWFPIEMREADARVLAAALSPTEAMRAHS